MLDIKFTLAFAAHKNLIQVNSLYTWTLYLLSELQESGTHFRLVAPRGTRLLSQCTGGWSLAAPRVNRFFAPIHQRRCTRPQVPFFMSSIWPDWDSNPN